MKKELGGAILIGLILGLIVTYGIYIARQAPNQLSELSTSPSPQAQASGIHNSIVINSPTNESVIADKQVAISGTSDANSTVVISNQSQIWVVKADVSGNFAKDLTLNGGLNILNIQAIDEQNQVAEEQLVVYVGKLDFNSPTATTAATASASPKAKTKN